MHWYLNGPWMAGLQDGHDLRICITLDLEVSGWWCCCWFWDGQFWDGQFLLETLLEQHSAPDKGALVVRSFAKGTIKAEAAGKKACILLQIDFTI